MYAQDYYKTLTRCINDIDNDNIDQVINILKDAVEQDRWIFTCGNGGSASTASHYVTDWGKMRYVNTGQKFKAMCLSDNIGMVTAYANDISYDHIFDHSLDNYASQHDVLIAISGSGNSKNVINAVMKAKLIGLTTICIVGYDGGNLSKVADHVVHFESNDMQICEDLHLSFGHIVMKQLCDI